MTKKRYKNKSLHSSKNSDKISRNISRDIPNGRRSEVVRINCFKLPRRDTWSIIHDCSVVTYPHQSFVSRSLIFGSFIDVRTSNSLPLFAVVYFWLITRFCGYSNTSSLWVLTAPQRCLWPDYLWLSCDNTEFGYFEETCQSRPCGRILIYVLLFVSLFGWIFLFVLISALKLGSLCYLLCFFDVSGVSSDDLGIKFYTQTHQKFWYFVRIGYSFQSQTFLLEPIFLPESDVFVRFWYFCKSWIFL
jgi:hypothetical protein